MTKIENAIIDGFRVYVNIAQGRIDRMSELNEGQRSALFAFFEHMTGIRHVYDIRRSSSEMFLILSSMGFCTKRISDFMGVGESSVRSIKSRIAGNRTVVEMIREFLDITSASGMRTYVRSLCFILVKAVDDLYPCGTISLEHPVSKGYFCKLHIDRTIGLDDVSRIKKRMQEIIDEDLPITRYEQRTEDISRKEA